MADDLLQKTAIIEHYVMNTHSGKPLVVKFCVSGGFNRYLVLHGQNIAVKVYVILMSNLGYSGKCCKRLLSGHEV